MKSKIEIGKLGNLGEVNGHSDDWWIVNKFNQIIEKQNEIIDYLNSQDQEENEPEKVYVDPIVPDFIAEKLAEERYNTREILLNGTKPLEVEDTPEEWVDRIRDLILDISADRLVSSEKVVAIVQSLLDDREREVVGKIYSWYWGLTENDFEKELDKLNSKKK